MPLESRGESEVYWRRGRRGFKGVALIRVVYELLSGRKIGVDRKTDNHRLLLYYASVSLNIKLHARIHHPPSPPLLHFPLPMRFFAFSDNNDLNNTIYSFI